ncbi:MAG: HD domain-containing protein [Agathobacter sp.]|uniref:HD-GYP domain-containing protein n=1 Tax=Agathobacter sp. TaxID=2021311 RepID=UPI002588154F|nr:HD domain-containing phosphohydrolase [Agathobacter sp.]MCR5677025.1 HD domain-containing protein [Agathobacter sp.]
MRTLTPHELQPGMILVGTVKTQTGQILGEAGGEVTRQLINRMKLYRVDFAQVEDDPHQAVAEVVEQTLAASEQPVVEEPVKPEPVKSERPTMEHTYIKESKTAKQRVAESPQFMGFQMEYYHAISVLKDAFAATIDKGTPLNPEELLESIKPLYQKRDTIVELFDMLNNLRALDDTIYAHSINVALVARMIGRWLRIDKQSLDIITEAGLIHDIGKCLIPEEVLNKQGKLTDEEFDLIRSHPKLGYKLIKGMDLDSRIKKATLQHHERCDGTGYPTGLDEDNIDEVAMIIAIADVYDAMTAARSYRIPLCAFQVIAKFEEEGFQKYPIKFIMTFLRQIAMTYQSNRVVLNDGRSCKIIMLNKNDLSRPMVKFDDNSIIDLSHTRDLFIKAII